MAERASTHEPPAIDPHGSPWPVPAVEGIPFDDDSDEAHAIARVLGEVHPAADEETEQSTAP